MRFPFPDAAVDGSARTRPERRACPVPGARRAHPTTGRLRRGGGSRCRDQLSFLIRVRSGRKVMSLTPEWQDRKCEATRASALPPAARGGSRRRSGNFLRGGRGFRTLLILAPARSHNPPCRSINGPSNVAVAKF